MLSKHGLVDPILIEKKTKRTDDMTRWPVISIGNILAYILEKNVRQGILWMP